MKHLLTIIITPYLLIACGQRGNHTGLAATDYSVQKTKNWSIKFSEDDQALIEKRTHLHHDITLEKKTLKIPPSKNSISFDHQNSNPIISDIQSNKPQMIFTDLKTSEYRLALPIITHFTEDPDGISFQLTKVLDQNLIHENIDFCEMSDDKNLSGNHFIFKEKITFEKMENDLFTKDGIIIIDFQTKLHLCKKVLKEIYTLNYGANSNSPLENLFKKMGLNLNNGDLLHLSRDTGKAILFRYDYIPLNITINIGEQLQFTPQTIQVDMDLTEKNLPKILPGKYQKISFMNLKPKKHLKTSVEHVVEIKREVVYSETCMQSGERKSCEKGKLVEKDIGPNLTTEEEIIVFEEIPMKNDESDLWKSYFFSSDDFTLDSPKQLIENSAQQIFTLKKQRSIHYPFNNKPSGIIEVSENEVVSSPKVRLNAQKTFHQMKSAERSYSTTMKTTK